MQSSPMRAALPHAPPEDVGIRSERLQHIGRLVAAGIAAGELPGCVVSAGRRGKIFFQKAYGSRQQQPETIPMSVDTVFDLASITKPVATATSVMMLVEQGALRVRDRVTHYIPRFGTEGKDFITIRHLLTHQAGFVPDNPLDDYRNGRQQAFENIYRLGTDYEPGTRFVYSDVGFILLDDLIERVSGQTVAEFSKQHLFVPLGMKDTQFLPSPGMRRRTAATEQRDAQWLIGEVHDPRASLMGGVAGHAGLFSTVGDLSIYAQMMLNGGRYEGKRILAQSTIDWMTRDHEIVEGRKVSVRGLGWDKRTGYSSNRGENFTHRAFGHGGFTGTVLWMDPGLDLFFVFLSNRHHPDGKGSINRLAGQIGTILAGAIDDSLPSPRRRTSAVLPGIDVLRRREFAPLRGQRVGLITNQTGRSCDGTSSAEILWQSPQVDLRALFSPEHGIHGQLDQAVINDSVGERQLPVYSLYGTERQPTAKQLASLDCLVFDVQDIGTRFYTYVSTMGLAMQAAAKHGKRFVVLDRPNPLGGEMVGGPLLDVGEESFVAFHPLPLRHGMTVGELAQMIRVEQSLELDLEVIACRDWHRTQWFDETGLAWVNPSPNIRNIKQALLYPGIGVWETTNLSVGRGTDSPFEIVGAPWIDGQALAARLNDSDIPGCRVSPIAFRPQSSKHSGSMCGGVYVAVTDRGRFDPIRFGMELGRCLWRLYPNQWDVGSAATLLKHRRTIEQIRQGHDVSSIMASWQAGLDAFRSRRAAFLLYDAN